MKKSIIAIGILFLGGCASTKPNVEWVSVKNTDEFTDVSTCKVTVGSLYTHSNVYTEVGKFYPFIEEIDSELLVGLQSGGKYKIPVGNAQLRIDSKKAWNISTSETPIKLTNTLPIQAAYVENLSEEQRKIVESSYDSAMKMSTQAMSPFTATTGEKALSILKEMLQGKTLKYRTIGFNQAASTTGEYKLDQSLKTSLTECGIEL